MSTDPETTRIVRSWLDEGVTRLPDPVLDAVLDQLPATPQRRAGWPAWRSPIMNKIAGFGLAAAALVAVVLIGAQLFGTPPGGTGGPGAQSSTRPKATPEASASAEPSPPSDGSLPEGSFRVQDAGALPDSPSITVTIPGPRWVALPEFGGLNRLPDSDPPTAMLLWAFPAGTTVNVYGDPCRWSTVESTAARTVDEVAAALAAQPSRDASEPMEVTVGEHRAMHLVLHVPEDAVLRDCDQGIFASYAIDGSEPYRTHQGPGQIDELWIVDVDGQIAIITAMYLPHTTTAILDEMRAIAESVTFGE